MSKFCSTVWIMSFCKNQKASKFRSSLPVSFFCSALVILIANAVRAIPDPYLPECAVRMSHLVNHSTYLSILNLEQTACLNNTCANGGASMDCTCDDWWPLYCCSSETCTSEEEVGGQWILSTSVSFIIAKLCIRNSAGRAVILQRTISLLVSWHRHLHN